MRHNGEPVGERKIRNKSDEILPIYITHSAILFVALYSRREHAFTVTRAEIEKFENRIDTRFPRTESNLIIAAMKL